METRWEKLGVDYPDKLTSMNNLTFMWKGERRDMEAISLRTECVQCRERALRVNHPASIFSSMALAEWSTEEASTGNGSTGT